jgi:hypothetical protein
MMMMPAMMPIIILYAGRFAKINITANCAIDKVVLTTLIILYKFLFSLKLAPNMKLQKNHIKTFTSTSIDIIK